MQQRATEILSNAAEYFENTLTSELDQVFQDAIKDAVQAIIEEIAESLGMMELGASITSALTPILPEILAAKALMEVIKGALSLIGI